MRDYLEPIVLFVISLGLIHGVTELGFSGKPEVLVSFMKEHVYDEQRSEYSGLPNDSHTIICNIPTISIP